MKQNEFIGKKNARVCKILIYIKHLLILDSTVNGYISISAFRFCVEFL